MVKINNDQLKILISAILDEKLSSNKINEQLKTLKINPVKLTAKFDTSEFQKQVDTATKTQKPKISAKIDVDKESIKQVTAEFSKINLELDKQKLSNRMTSWLNDNSKAASTFGDRIRDLQVELDGVDTKAGLTNINKQFQAATSEARALGVTGKTAFENITTAAMRLTQYFSVAAIFGMATREIRQMVAVTKELNQVAVDLQIASGYTKEQVSGLMDTYNQLGQRIGATTVEVSKSADSWLRQGYSIEQTNKLIEASMMLSKLGQIDSAEATQYLTSAMKGYKLSAEDVVSVVDKLSAVDMQAAVSAGGIAEGLSEVANSANIAGISMDKLIGYLTVIGEVTQASMSQVGNTLNRIFARMGNIKLGRLDDYENSGEDLNNVETVLRGLDIQLRDSSEEFRNFGDVLDETASKWNTYNSVQKNAIAVAFSGVHGREEFLVLMENYGKALEYAGVSIDSFGTATEKMKVYEDGLEASTKRATAAFEALSSTVINSDFLKGAVDTGTGLLGAVNWLLKNLGTIPVLIGAITASLSISKNAGKNSKLPSYPEAMVA